MNQILEYVKNMKKDIKIFIQIATVFVLMAPFTEVSQIIKMGTGRGNQVMKKICGETLILDLSFYVKILMKQSRGI